MHPLKRYLRRERITAEDFAKRVDTTASYISQIVCGYRHPARVLALEIERATNGAVTIAELFAWTPATDADAEPAKSDSDAPAADPSIKLSAEPAE